MSQCPYCQAELDPRIDEEICPKCGKEIAAFDPNATIDDAATSDAATSDAATSDAATSNDTFNDDATSGGRAVMGAADEDPNATLPEDSIDPFATTSGFVDTTIDGDIPKSNQTLDEDSDATIDAATPKSELTIDEGFGATIDAAESDADLTIDEAAMATIESVPSGGVNTDETLHSDAPDQDGTPDPDATMDSSAGSAAGDFTMESGDGSSICSAETMDPSVDSATGSRVTMDSGDGSATGSSVTMDSADGSAAGSSVTMDSSAGSSGSQGSSGDSARSSSPSVFNSQVGVTGNASKLAQMWNKAGGGSATPMSSLGSDEQIASSSLFAKLRPRTLAESDAPNVGDSDYEILDKLGEGAMGVVFAARQKAMDRTVAIKAIKPGKHESEDSKRKFLYEAQITGDLDHPNIVPIHELGSNADGTLFYAMKMVSGNPWQNAIKDKSREENLDILMKTCDAMGFAHSKGIIHRDLKPENVMLGPFGEVLVMDWGLAISILRRQPFGIGGTPAYMSPEMARHDVKRIGPASDIYLLGAMLFQIVTGRPPHPGKKVRDCLMAAARNKLAPHDENDPLIVIAKVAMADDVVDRYESVAAMQDAIREYRRHAESIQITDRAMAVLEEAESHRDYNGFSRGLYSLEEALELWPANEIAKRQIGSARLAYGRCAFEKGDHDLCLQTLVGGSPEEDELIAKAKDARDIAASREQKFKRLRRVLAAVILFAVVGLSALSLSLNSAKMEIDKKAVQLEEKNSELVTANDSERAARKHAEEATKQEQLAKEDAIRAADAESLAKVEAEKSAVKARQSARAEANARKDEFKAREAAESALASEKVALEKSRRSAMVTTMGSYQSRLNLAFAQARQYDVARSSQLLSEIDKIETRFPNDFGRGAPLLSNWAYRRVGLLTNEDLPRVDVGPNPQSISMAASMPIVSTIDGDGKLQRIRFKTNSESQSLIAPSFDGKAVNVATSSDGTELAFMTLNADKRFASWIWDDSSKLAVELPGISARPLQKLSYSPNDQWLVGGINGGLWIWKRDNEQFSQLPKRALAKGTLWGIGFGTVSGRDVAFCLVGVSSGEQSSRSLLILDLEKAETTAIELPASIRDQISAIATLGSQGDLVVGLESGQLFHLQTNGTRLTVAGEVLPRKHATRVSQIDVGPAERFVSRGNEPVVHVWSINTDGEKQIITHEQPLLGLANNVQWSGFSADGRSVLAIDQAGQSINWELAQQAVRRNIVPMIGNRSGKVGLPATIENIAASPKAQTFQAIDGNGVLVQYDIGATQKTGSDMTEPMAVQYVGHTPGADIMDSALSVQQAQLVTLARRAGGNQYVAGSSLGDIEFCQWDMKTGNMLRRLKLDIQSEARVEVAAGGTVACVGGESATHFIDLNKSTAVTHSFGSAFAVANPTADNRVMLVRNTGAVQLIDATQSDQPAINQFQMAAYSEAQPVEGSWSTSGEFFYVLYENGRIARYAVGDQSISEPILADAFDSLRVLQRSRAWQSVDLHVTSGKPGIDELLCIVRNTDNQVKSRFSRVSWVNGSEQPQLTSDEWIDGDQRLAAVDSSEAFQPISLDSIGLSVPSRSIRGLLQIDQKRWIAIGSDGGIRTGTEKLTQWVARTGRTQCVSASPDRIGKRWLALHDNGCLWKIDNAAAEPMWTQVTGIDGDLSSVTLSPSGSTAICLGRPRNGFSRLTLLDVETGKVVLQKDNVANAAWHPNEDRFILASTSGELAELRGDDQYQSSTTFSSIKLNNDRIRDVNYFRDASSLGDGKWYAAVARDHGTGSRVSMHSLEIEREIGIEKQPGTSEFGYLDSKTPIRSVACSPTENVLVTGDVSGTLIVWFASPSIDEEPRELFTLPGHRGAPITGITFSQDGTVIFSADSEARLLGHPSIPPNTNGLSLASHNPSP